MKKLFCAAAASFVLCAGSLCAQTSVTIEQFSYTPGDLVTNSAGLWSGHSGAGTNNEIVTTNSLTYPGLTGTTGGATTFTLSGQDVNRPITTMTLTGAGETAYYSAVISLSSAQATGDYFMHFIDSTVLTSNFRGRLFAKSSGAGYVLGIAHSANNAGTVTYDTTVLNFNTSVFVVVKLTSVSGAANDTTGLFINPTLGAAEPAPTQVSADAPTDPPFVDRIAIRQGSATATPAGTIDSIRTGPTWASVTGINASTVPEWNSY